MSTKLLCRHTDSCPYTVPAADQQGAGLRLLTEVSVPQIQFDPFEALVAAHQTDTFDSDDSSSPSNESSQPVEGNGPHRQGRAL